MTLRCIVGARVSVLTGPQKVSQLAQIETGASWVGRNDGEVIGTFEDLGVSATVPPPARPDLGPWLTDPEKVQEWDAIVFSKMDRAFRSTQHCVDLARWAEENKKLLVFAEDGLVLDYRDGRSDTIDGMMSELFVYLGSFFAQLELNRFRTRALDAHRVLRPTDRWATGRAPFGYRVCDHPSGKGRGLEQDPEQQETLHRLAQLVLDGESLNDAARAVGQPATSVAGWLSNPNTQGWKTSSGEYVLDPDGDPIRLAPPTFDPKTWNELHQALALRRGSSRRKRSTNPMLGVGYCARCGKGLAQQFTGDHRYYRCSKKPQCRNSTVRADLVDALLEEQFLEEFGDREVTRRVWQQGTDTAEELERVEGQIRRLRAEQDAGLVVTDEDHEEYLRRLGVLIAKRGLLQESEPVLSGWVHQSTGETFSGVWRVLPTPEQRSETLREAGVRFELASANPLEWRVRMP